MNRFLDVFLAVFAAIVFAVPIFFICVGIKCSSKGPVLYWSKRIGKKNKIFHMPKFRTMVVDTPVVATEELKNPSRYVTSIGKWLRKTSLDELPQFFCVLTGKMSIVGPRPALFNQYSLIELRSKNGIDTVLPGITGWAQVNGRDNLSIESKVEFDKIYLKQKSILFDLKIIFLTIIKVFKSDDVHH